MALRLLPCSRTRGMRRNESPNSICPALIQHASQASTPPEMLFEQQSGCKGQRHARHRHACLLCQQLQRRINLWSRRRQLQRRFIC